VPPWGADSAAGDPGSSWPPTAGEAPQGYPAPTRTPRIADGGRPRAGVSRGLPQTPTRAPPPPSRRYGPAGWDGLCVNCRNQCGPDWHIFGRSPPD